MKSLIPPKISEPEILKTPDFEVLRESFSGFMAEYLAERQSPEAKESFQALLNNPSEPISLCLDAFVVLAQHWVRQKNADAKQMFALYAQGDMLDLKASELGLQRKEGESDESLRERYYLAHYAFTSAGTAKAYQYHALSLGAAPDVKMQKSEDGQTLLVEYKFSNSDAAVNVLDASVKRMNDNGLLHIAILLPDGFDEQKAGVLRQEAELYLNKDNVSPVNYDVKVELATRVPVEIHLKIRGLGGPEKSLLKSQLLADLKRYLAGLKLGEPVDQAYLNYLAYENKAPNIEVLSPAADHKIAWNQLAVCSEESIKIEFDY